jgi:hypothetical protein
MANWHAEAEYFLFLHLQVLDTWLNKKKVLNNKKQTVNQQATKQ